MIVTKRAACGGYQNRRASSRRQARSRLVSRRRPDQGFDLASERAVVHRPIEGAAAFALDDRGQVERALTAALPYEHHVDAVTTRYVAVNALHTLDRSRRVRIAQNQSRPLHRDTIHEQSERNVHDLVAARAQGRDQSLRFRGGVAHEDQGPDFGRAP